MVILISSLCLCLYLYAGVKLATRFRDRVRVRMDILDRRAKIRYANQEAGYEAALRNYEETWAYIDQKNKDASLDPFLTVNRAELHQSDTFLTAVLVLYILAWLPIHASVWWRHWLVRRQ